MPLLSFQEQFVEAVENGLDLRAGRPLRHPGVRPKTQTIRAYWKNGHNPHRAGLIEKMWTKVRTPERRKLGEAKCRSIRKIALGRVEISRVHETDKHPEVFWEVRIGSNFVYEWPGTHEYERRAFRRLARLDGFSSVLEMAKWFEKTHGLPFEGVLIRW